MLFGGSICFGFSAFLVADVIFNRPVAGEFESEAEVIKAITQELDRSEVLHFAESNTDPYRGTERFRENAQ